MARVGAARIFFDVVGSFQAQKFITQTKQGMLAYRNITTSILIDTMTAVSDSVLLFAEAFQAVLDNTVSLATNVSLARIEFEKFAGGIEGVRLKEMQQDLRDLGEEFAFTAEESFNAGARMSQLSGILKSQEAILAATKGSLQFGFVGGMTSETAAQRMIQLHAQTNFMFGENTQAQYDLMSAQKQADVVTENLTKTISGLNTIENRSAATMAQLTFVMNQFAASAMLAGDSIEQMAAMSAVLIEAGEEQGKAGRALRMIYARLGADTSDNNQILERYVGTIRDANGDLLPLSVILGKLAENYDDLSSAEKNAIAQAVAGNDHYVRFLKLMEGYDRSVTLATQASQGLDSVVEEMELFTGDPSFQLKILQAELENVREEMGQNLTPIVIGQTKAQIAMTQANADLIATLVELGDALGIEEGGIAFVFAQLTELTNNLARGFNNYINIKNMSVALQTQLLIMQAITGERFIQAQGTERQNRVTADVNELLDAQALIKERLSALDYREANQRTYIQEVQQTILRQENQIAILKEEEKTALISIGALNAELQNKDRLRLDVIDVHLQRQKEITTELRAQLRLDNERANLTGMLDHFTTRSGNVSPTKLDNLRKQIPLLERINTQDKETIGNMQSQLLLLELEAGALNKTDTKLEEKIANQRNEIAAAKQKAKVNDKAIIQGKQLLDILETENFARKSGVFNENELILIRSLLSEETDLLTLETMQLADEERALVAVLLEAAAAGRDLKQSIREVALAKEHAADASHDMRLGEKSQTEEMKEFNKQLDTMNLRMNAVTMGAGLASSAITMFGGAVGLDKRESAAAAMTAMHLSTIPNTISTVLMTASMVKAAGAATTFAGALRMVAGPMGIAFGAVSVLSVILGKYSASKARATEREKEHAAAIKATNEALLSEAGGLDYALITDETLTNQQLIADIREDDAQLAILNEKDKLNSLETLQKQELEESLEHNKALLLARAGLALEDDKITEDMISNMVKYEGDLSRIHDRIVDDTFSLNRDLQHLADLNDEQDSPIDTHALTRRVEFFEDSIANLGLTIQDLEALGGDIELFAALFEIGFLNAESTIDDFVAIINALPDEIRDNTDEVTSQFDEMESSITGFSSALEEFYYGGQISMATGDLLKQVVQKGAENLIQNTELIMTNNFYGLTLPEMVDTISNAVTDQLVQQGIVQSSGMAT